MNLIRKYIVKETKLDKCDLCQTWCKGKEYGGRELFLIEPENKLRFNDHIILCGSCIEKKNLGGFKNE